MIILKLYDSEYGFYMWPSAIVLAEFILQNRNSLFKAPEANILEVCFLSQLSKLFVFVWYSFFGVLAWLRHVSAISCIAKVLSVESSNTHWQVTWRLTIGQSYQAGIGFERTITDWLQCPRPELAEFRLWQNW